MLNPATLTRAVAVAALAVAVVALAAIIAGGGGGYVLYAQFRDAGSLRQGFKVRIDGAPVGQVESLDLGPHDYAVAKLRLESSAAPMGRNATATVRAADLLGEKYVDLQPGNRSDPAPSGSVIPPNRTGLAVELDDVLNSLDTQTRDALHAFINEQGSAFVGRGGDLAATLAVLPPSLDQTQQFLAQFGRDNAALGRLVDESDRVVGAVVSQRDHLGALVGSASGTLATLAARSGQLGATVARAPAMLVSLRRTLAALQGAAIPLGPAAQGLAATAPKLTATLEQLPPFYAAVRPTLDVIRQVSPTLQSLGTGGTPVVRRLRPLTGELATFASAFDPVTRTLDQGAADILGVLEGWARSTQARDAASHVFRFGVTVGPDTFSALAPLLGAASAAKPATQRAARRAAPPAIPAVHVPAVGPASTPGKPTLSLPKLPALNLQASVKQAQATVKHVLQQLGLGGGAPGGNPGGAPGGNPAGNLQSLVDYLLK
jgi:phospholipid/cholesterol/gamma-HCH transport system substrate-binding protein